MSKEREWLEVKVDTTTLFTAFGVGGMDDPKDKLVSKMEGWRQLKVDISTVPKLFGAGSYLTERSVPSREVEFSFHFFGSDDHLALLEVIKGHAQSFTQFTMVFHSRGGAQVETLRGFVSVVGEPSRWIERTDFDMSFIAVDPNLETELDPDYEFPDPEEPVDPEEPEEPEDPETP